MTTTDARGSHRSRNTETGLEQNGQTYTERHLEDSDLFSCLWKSSSSPDRADAPERIIPDLCADFIADSTGKAWLVGPATTADLVTTPPGVTLWGVRIYPPSLRAILGTDAESVQNSKIEFTDILSTRTARILADALRREDVDAELFRSLWPQARTDDVTRAGYAALTGSPDVRVREIAADLGVSDRHFRRTISSSIGLAPKMIQKVARMQKVLALSRTDTPPLAVLAAHAGYADQAHMSRDVRALTGGTTTQLLRQGR